ncbi:MAG: hypothetical protein UMU76_08045 [Prosthecochloris sp.]|nr:hypothetical protein [Prosthecochloris sp.]
MEQYTKSYYFEKLKKYFYIEREVKGTHFSNKTMIIDAIIKPIDMTMWKNKNVAFGIEFKDTQMLSRTFDTKNYTKWLAQSTDYANTEWNNYGYIYILVCPSISQLLPCSVTESYNFTAHLLAQLGIGELQELERHGLTIVLNQTHKIWSETDGVKEGQRYNLQRKFGAR